MKNFLNIKNIFLVLGPLLFLFFFFYKPLNASSEVNKMTGIVFWMAAWWFTECVHLAITSLLPIVLIPFSQIAAVKDVSKEYGDSIIFLFLGGFLISIAIEKWELHKRIAKSILQITGKTMSDILIGIMLSTFLISNWISNTATSLMLFGVIMALIKEIGMNMNGRDKSLLSAALMLGMAYSASIGGIATPVGTPPNMYFFKVYPRIFGNQMHISFIEWIQFFFPLSVLIMLGCYFILKILFLNKISLKKINLESIELSEKHKITHEEKIIILIFLITVLLWLTSTSISVGKYTFKGWKEFFQHPEYFDDSVVAIVSALLLFIIPSKRNKGEGILIWKDVKRLRYEILLLFGGGFALAFGFEKSGLIEYMVHQLEFVRYFHPLLVILFISVTVVIISEFASNIASIQLALPVIAAMVVHFQQDYIMRLIFPCVLSSSVGFMLPVATAPNTIAFGSGLISMRQMLKAGFWLDVFSIFTISLYCYFVL